MTKKWKCPSTAPFIRCTTTADEVSSPTFTLIQEYRGGRLPLFHVDLYRIEDPREFDELGLDEIAEDGVLAIEWADRYPRPPQGAVRVRIEHAGESQRRVGIEASTKYEV